MGDDSEEEEHERKLKLRMESARNTEDRNEANPHSTIENEQQEANEINQATKQPNLQSKD